MRIKKICDQLTLLYKYIGVLQLCCCGYNVSLSMMFCEFYSLAGKMFNAMLYPLRPSNKTQHKLTNKNKRKKSRTNKWRPYR